MKEVKLFPEPISLKKLIGPSFVILALGLGSGEVILWPYLTANYGLGIAWGRCGFGGRAGRRRREAGGGRPRRGRTRMEIREGSREGDGTRA